MPCHPWAYSTSNPAALLPFSSLLSTPPRLPRQGPHHQERGARCIVQRWPQVSSPSRPPLPVARQGPLPAKGARRRRGGRRGCAGKTHNPLIEPNRTPEGNSRLGSNFPNSKAPENSEGAGGGAVAAQTRLSRTTFHSSKRESSLLTTYWSESTLSL